MKQLNDSQKKLLVQSVNSEVFKLAVKSAFNHIIITDIDGTVLYANEAVERITGYSQKEIIGNNPRLWGQQMPPEFYEELWKVIKEDKQTFSGELKNKRENGEVYDAKAIISPIMDENDELIGFIGTEEDITRQKEVDRMKTEFVSITAHQLKTPMTGIRWNAELLEEKLINKEYKNILQLIKQIKQSNEWLLQLVNELLNITRIESGRITIEPIATDLNKLVLSNLTTHAIHAQKKSISLETQLDSSLEEISIDESMFAEIFHNLTSNAIKYSPKNSTIIFRTKKESARVIFEVEDHGIGIPKGEEDRVFQKHFRCSNVVEEKIDGTGLGLYFIKLVVEAAGGEISFNSEANKGTIFTVAFPLEGMKGKEGEVRLN